MSERLQIEAQRLVDRAHGLIAHINALALDDVDAAGIPVPIPARAADIDLLRAVAALYLTASFEAAGVIPAAEDLTKLVRSGVIRRNFGDGIKLLQDFWSNRDHRASQAERLAFFADVFGVPPDAERSGRRINVEFEERLLDLCEAIYRSADAGAGTTARAQVRRTAGRLIDNLMTVAGGMTAMMTQDILTTQREAIGLLSNAAIRRALNAQTMWDVVSYVDQIMRRPNSDARAHIDRGRAGFTIITWLAGLAGGSGDVTRANASTDEKLVDAAVDWLEASLKLGEATQTAAPPPDDAAAPAGNGGARQDDSLLAALGR